MSTLLRHFPWLMALTLLLPTTTHSLAAQPGNSNLALCVGVNTYQNHPALTTPAQDAHAVGSALKNTGSFRKVVVLAELTPDNNTNAARFHPTSKNIADILTLFSRSAAPDANIVVYLAGYGEMKENTPAFLPLSTNPEPGLALTKLADILGDKAKNTTFLLDAANAANPENTMTIAAADMRGATTFVSHENGQKPLVDETSGRGLFSLALENALPLFNNNAPTPTHGELLSNINDFMSEYCLDNLVVAGQSATLFGNTELTLLKNMPPPATTPATPPESAREKTTPSPQAALARRKGESFHEAGEYAAALPLYLQAAESGDAVAAKHLGDMYLEGTGVERDYAKALAWYLQSAEKGHAAAQTNAGFMYRYALGTKVNYAQAMHWYEKAAAQDDAMATYYLAALYSNGLGTPKNKEKSARLFAKTRDANLPATLLKAAEQGRAADQCHLAAVLSISNAESGIPENFEQAAFWSRKAANQGLPVAQNRLGFLYQKGKGVPRDDAQAVFWIKKAAEQGNISAQNNLAHLHYNGIGVQQDYIQATYWYRMSAEQGSASAQFAMGDIYATGKGGTLDYAKAASWYEKAAGQDHAGGQTALGNLYYSGKGVAQDYRLAAYWLKKAAEQDNTVAQHLLAGLYYAGKGVEQDYAQSLSWYRKAAEEGQAQSQTVMGNFYYEGKTLSQDSAQAALWYEKAAEQGHAEAQNSLGNLYQRGEGVPQDHVRAAFWYQKAAEQGYAFGQYNIACLYESGKGVTQNYGQALHWHKLASAQGYGPASNAIGVLYGTGKGVSQDYSEAERWLTLAVSQGSAKAGENLVALRNNAESSRQRAAQNVARANNNVEIDTREWIVCDCATDPDCVLFCYDEDAIAAGESAQWQLDDDYDYGDEDYDGGGSNWRTAASLLGIVSSFIPMGGGGGGVPVFDTPNF